MAEEIISDIPESIMGTAQRLSNEAHIALNEVKTTTFEIQGETMDAADTLFKSMSRVSRSPSTCSTDSSTPSNLMSVLASSSINLVLPFVNGMMLGFGELVAHEIGFKYGWTGAKVYPEKRMQEKEERSKYL